MPAKPARSIPFLTALVAAIPAIAAASPVEPAGPGAEPATENAEDRDTDVADSRGSADRVAYAGPGSYAPEPLAPPAPAPAAQGLAAFNARDAAAGRASVSPTALTAPRGKVTFGWYSPIVPVAGAATVGFGLTDRIQLSIGTTFTAEGRSYDDCYDCYGTRDDGGSLFVAKVGIYQGNRTALAAQVAFVEVDGERISTWSAVLSHCIDGAACNTVLSGHLTFVPDGDTYDDSGNPASALHAVMGGSLISGAGKLKVVLDGAAFGDDEKLLVGYGGVRYAGRRFSADVGMVMGIEDGDAEVLPMPLLALSARL